MIKVWIVIYKPLKRYIDNVETMKVKRYIYNFETMKVKMCFGNQWLNQQEISEKNVEVFVTQRGNCINIHF